MDPLASEDTVNAPGAVSDELINAENEQLEQQQQQQDQPDAQGAPPHCANTFTQP